MADFIEDKAAEEREGEEEPNEDDEFAGLPEDEAEASDSGSSDGSGSSSDEEEDGEDVKDKFIVQEGEDADEEGDDEEEKESEDAQKKKKKRRRRELVLEEDDYELLEENTGIRRVRPQQHRRLKKARDMTRGDDAEQLDADQLKEELFGPDEEDLEDDIGDDVVLKSSGGGGGQSGRTGAPSSKQEQKFEEEDQDDIFDEDEDDWIVNEFEEEGEGAEGAAEAAAARRRRRKKAALDGLPGVDPAALDEANEIFGDVDDLLAKYEARRVQREGVDAAGEEEADAYADIDEDELDDDEAVDELRRQRQERQRETAARRVRDHLEPGAVERHFLLPKDERIREVDLPEREQLRRGAEPENFKIKECAVWIAGRILDNRMNYRACQVLEDGMREVEGPPPKWMGVSTWPNRSLRDNLQDTSSLRGLLLSRSERDIDSWEDNNDAMDALRDSIIAALELIYSGHEEVPLLGMYRKERLGELLSLQEDDQPAENTGKDRGVPRGAISATDRRVRRWDVLYAVQQAAQQWRALQKRKEAREAAYLRALEVAVEDEERVAVQACIDALDDVQTMEELDDVEAKFRLAVPPPEESLAALDLDSAPPSQGQTLRRRPQRAAAHQIAVRAGLLEAAAGIGMTSGQCAENIEKGYKQHEPTDPSTSPEEYAGNFIDEHIPARRDTDTVLKSIVAIVSAEIAAEPAVRKAVREYFWKNATVSSELLPAGDSALGPFHPLGIAKRIKGYPVKSMKYDTFLRLVAAENEGYIRLRIDLHPPPPRAEREEGEDGGSGGGGGGDHLPPRQENRSLDALEEEGVQLAIEMLQDFYMSGSLGKTAQQWNKLRLTALKEAVVSGTLPALKREVKARLLSDSRTYALQAASSTLWDLAKRAPVSVKALATEDEEEEEVAEKRIMSVVFGTSASAATTLVMTDPSGNLVDYLHCPQFTGQVPKPRIVANEAYLLAHDPRKAEDAKKIEEFIMAHLPHVIVVGVAHPDAINLYEDMERIVEAAYVNNPRQMRMEIARIQQIAADETVAALWENCAAAREELPSSAPIVRRGIALARQALEPLAVLASLCGPSKEVLSLRLHPMQEQLSEEARLRAVEEVLCSVTAQVGVDLNAAAAHGWLAAPLAFVPGLGPRKAVALMRAIARSGGHVESRMQVWRELGVMGNCVFRNAAPYLRIRASSKATANLELDLLDDTRIHPESYTNAVQIAQSVAEGVDADVAVENAMALPHDVEALELGLYDKHLQEQEAAEAAAAAAAAAEGGAADGADEAAAAPSSQSTPPGTKLSTLIDIQMEFVAPYGEVRPPVQNLSRAELFWLACGEGSATLIKGRKIEARVRYVAENFVRCIIPELNGLEAVINDGDVSSKQTTVDCRDYFKRGDTVVASIKEIKADAHLIELSTASGQLNRNWEAVVFEREHYYIAPTDAELAAAETSKRNLAARAAFMPRPIRHPLFQNISMQDAANAVLTSPVGTAIIRPDRKSLRKLHITMSLPGQQVWHVEVKEIGVASSNLSLAPPLQIQPVSGHIFTYDDLDEMVARFIEPVGSAMRALQRHRKWFGSEDGSCPSWKHQVFEKLKRDRSEFPKMAAYCLVADAETTGAFYVGYWAGSRPYREHFVVLPDGFYFRKKVYPTIDSLLNSFKHEFRNTEARRAAQQAAAAAMQPQLQPQQQQDYHQYQQQQQQYHQQQQQYQQPVYAAVPVHQQQHIGGWDQSGGQQWGPTTQDPHYVASQQQGYPQGQGQYPPQQQQQPPPQYPPAQSGGHYQQQYAR